MASPSKSAESSNWKKKSAGGPTSTLFTANRYGGNSSENDWKKTKAVAVSSGGGSCTSMRASPSTPKRSALQKAAKVFHLGTVLNVNYEKLFGLLAPVKAPAEGSSEGSKNVFFRFPPAGDQKMTVTSSTSTGGMRLIPGDVLEYELANYPHDESSSRQCRAHFAMLRECKHRSVSELERYGASLVACAEERPEIVLREITKCSVGFKLVLDCRHPSPELVRHTLELCQILSSARQTELYHPRLKQLYALFRGSLFVKHLSTATGSQRDQGFQNLDAGLLQDFLVHLLEFSPSQLPAVMPLLTRIDGAESFLKKILGVLAGGSSNESSGLRLPWSQLPLLPTMDEVRAFNPRSARSTLPVVKQEGPYASPEEYIDTYLRLLREDCFAGLLQGIHALRQGKVVDCDMHLWFEASVCGVHFNHNASPGLTLAVTLPKTKSKAPLGGSLVCFFDDSGGFDSPVWGVVSRCEDGLTDNKTCVCFVDIIVGAIGTSEPEMERESSWCLQCARIMQGEAMVMAESPTYYKAYQPVLETLQMTHPEDVPFRDELVSVTWPKDPAPEYLKSTDSGPVTLDWSCIFEPGHALQGLSDEIREGVGAVTSLVARGFKTSFDPSQLKAVEQAVNNRLCIIQGPPGTGKTYVGVKILQLLLSASTFPENSPVFVITLKNHALDQFLEKCLAFEDRIVRVGGRSKNQALDAYNLRTKMAIPKNDESRFEYAENIHTLSSLREEMKEEFDAINRCIRDFHPSIILDHAPDLHLSHFLERLYVQNRARMEACARRLPEGVTLVELLRGQFPIWDTDQELLANEVRERVVTEVMRWMPKPNAIQTALAFFSPKKPSSSTSLHRGPDSANNEEDESRKEEEERRTAYESLRQETTVESDADATSKTSNQWLESRNFMKFSTEEDRHRPSMTYCRLNLDAMGSQFDWLGHENPYDLSGEHRAILVYKYWQESVNRACQRLTSIKAEYDTLLLDMEHLNKRRQLAVLQGAKIIGMTTTGAAMHRSVVKLLAPAVVLVEEAAEILEPQVLASLNPQLQHLILIGDHHQLRPQVESYDLERWHGFGVSMFERLAEHNRLPFQPLVRQCRMREEFVPMLHPIYPFLQSHTALVSGSRNEAPACMATTMHFWSHGYPETSQRSFVNVGEAHMVVALARWIASELHSPESLKILAAYNGQVTLIRKLLGMRPSVDNVEVRSIDSFQGAESEIVIVSLVRSNEEGKIGHLSMRNRLCVSASRARCGVYFVGNHNTLTKKSEHWRTLIGYLEGRNALDSCVSLCCPRHPDRPPFALSDTAASQFKPSDVCGYPCQEVLLCDHVCRLPCHAGDHAQCKEPVDFNFWFCGHSLTKMCYQDKHEFVCKTRVIHKFTPCEHSAETECWKVTGVNKLQLKCQVVCGKELKCSHMCKLPCSEKCESAPCEDCQEIEQEKQRIKREILIKAIANKRKELDEEILKLREKVDEGIVVQEVHPHGDSAQSYFMAKDRAEKYTQPDCKTVVAVTKVQKIENLGLQKKFLEAQKELFDLLEAPAWLFYGGSDDMLDQVVNKGFRHGKAHHFHVYSSSATEKHGNLLLCEVLLGKTWRAPNLESLGNNLDWNELRKKSYDSVSLVGGQEKGEELRPFAHVVYHPNQAIPRFLVSCKLLNLQALAERNGFDKFGEEQALRSGGMCRLPLLPALHFEGLTPEECHFRTAESQFFRMSQNRKKKVTKVELIKNVTLEENFNKKMQEFKASSIPAEARFVFHGTVAAAIDKIAAEGFKIGGTEGIEIKHGAVYGQGIYTASDPDISVAYCKGSDMMLLSIAIPGELNKHHNTGHTKDVLVIKDVCQLLPRYVVHYT